MAKFLSNISLETAHDIQFKNSAGTNTGKIESDGNNLVLSNAVGDILLGDGASDIFIGDGTNNVDILFEQSGSIKADDSATGVTITLGSSNTTIAFGGAVSFGGSVSSFSAGSANTVDLGASATPFLNLYAAHHVGSSSINYATSRGWVEDSAPLSSTQVGEFGGNFIRNGTDAENAVVRGQDPFNNKALLWKAIGNTSDDDADGGWNKDITIPANNDIGYLSYVYFKADFTADSGEDGQLYLGCGTTSGQTINISDDSSNTNPYFVSNQIATINNGSAAVANRWYLMIGVIQPHNDETTGTDTITGVYDVETGEKVLNGSEFKMGNNTTGQKHRTYLYYQDSNSAGNVYFWNPGFHAIDGSEPKLQDLLKRQTIADTLKVGRDKDNLIDFTTDNQIKFRVQGVNELGLEGSALYPVTSDGLALGYSNYQWSDLFLASGAVVNFNNGDVTLTHSGNNLAIAGGNLEFTGYGFVMDGNTITGIDDSGEFTNDDNHIMTSAAVEDKILGYGYTTNTGDYVQGNTLSAGTINFTGELNFTGNGAKYIDVYTLANSNDFTIRHHNETGNLFENAFRSTANGATNLFYDGNTKFATKSDGVDITGELQCDTLDVDGTGDISGNLTLGGFVLDGNTISGVDNDGEFTDDNSHIMTSAAINDRFAQINADTTGTAENANHANNLNAVDDRDMAPEDYGYGNDLKIFFSSKEGLEDGSSSGSNYQDVLYLNSYSDASGGDANILAFDKSEMKIYHYQADQAATNWGTAKEIAYTAGPTFTGTPAAPTAGAGTNTTQLATTAFVTTAVSNLVDSAPGTLNTLNELAAALGDDASFSTTVTNSIAAKLPLAGGTMSGAIAMGSNNITGGGTITGTTLTGTSLDVNGTADISSSLDVHGTIRNHNGSIIIEDSDSDNQHIQLTSNATEGLVRVNNGANWGLIARGVTNSPRVGAYHNGTLDIYGFGASDGADHADDDLLAQFNFSGEFFQVNGALDINGNADISGTTTSGSSITVSDGSHVGLTITGSGTSHTQGAILLKSGTSDTPEARGQGVFLFNEGDDATWYTGTQYQDADTWMVARKAGTSFDSSAATNAQSFFKISNAGAATFSSTLTVEGADAITIPDYILHAGDDSKFGFPSNDNFKVRLAGSDVFTMSTSVMSFTGEVEGASLDINGDADISGTITNATWNGDVIASAYLDSDTAHLSGATFTGNIAAPRVSAAGATFPQVFVEDTDSGGGSTKTMQVGMSGTSMYLKKSDATGSIIVRNSNNTNLMTIGLTDSGQVTVLNELEAGSLDINGNADISGDLTMSGHKIVKFSSTTYGAFDSEDFFRIKFQDVGGTHNDVGIGQTAINNLGFNTTAGGTFTFNDGTNGNVLTISNGQATFDGEIEGGSLDINGDGDVSGTLTIGTISATNYGLASGDIPNNAADTSGNAATATTAGTVTTAAQGNITSVGTLTSLTVSGNINANGNIVGDDGTNITNIASIAADTFAADADSSTRFDLTADEMLFLVQDEDVFSFATDFLISAKAKIPKRKLTKTGNTDGSADGDIVYFGSTTGMDTGKIYYFTSSGTWALADADAESTAKGMLGVALGAASDTNGVLVRGMVTLDHDPGTVGHTLFLHTTAGQATITAPSGNGHIVRVIGYLLDSTNGQIYFNPDGTFVEVTA